MRLPLILSLALLPATVMADDVTDTLDSARAAYEADHLDDAMKELTFAIQLIKQMRAGSLSDHLPPAQDGWTRTLNEDEASALAMMGGTAAAAEYTRDAESFSLTVMVDNPMMAGLINAFSSPAMMGTMGNLVRVGREKFVEQGGDLTGLIGNRIMVQANGADPEVMLPYLEAMDFAALEALGN